MATGPLVPWKKNGSDRKRKSVSRPWHDARCGVRGRELERRPYHTRPLGVQSRALRRVRRLYLRRGLQHFKLGVKYRYDDSR